MHSGAGRIVLSSALVALFAIGCPGGTGADAGPTTGTFHVEVTSASSANVPPTFDVGPPDGALHAYAYTHAPAQYLCGTAPLLEIIGVTGVLRAYVRLPQNPPVNGMHSLVNNPCGVYFTVAHTPGLPSEEQWIATSGMLTVSGVNGASFLVTITDAQMAPMTGTTGTFTVNALATVVNARGL